jgi:uncharacterized protein (TIGR03435 family)
LELTAFAHSKVERGSGERSAEQTLEFPRILNVRLSTADRVGLFDELMPKGDRVMKNHLGRALWTTLLAALSLGALFAQDFVGTWQGTLKNAKNGKELRLVAKISRAQNEKLAATFYSIDQNGAVLPAGTVTQQGTDLKIDIPAVGGNYAGKLTDANTITGTWTQGQPAPLDLVRATPQTAWEIPPPPAPPKSMAADVDPSFEVATIKPSAPGQQGLGINVNPTGAFSTRNTSLKDLLIFAYGVHPDQIQGLPGWASEDKYDIAGKPDHEGMGNDTQIRSMVKKLLTERFGLVIHREKKEISAYTLNMGRTGQHKLTVNDSGVNLPGFGGRGPGAIGVNNATMEQFAGFLQARIVDRPVVDKTGIVGKYNFTLTWRPDTLPPQPPGAPPLPADIESRSDIFGAMQEQLGLRLQAEKTPVEVLVIDKAAKPSEN